MKKTLIVVAVGIVCTTVGVLVYIKLNQTSVSNEPTPVSFPVGTTTTGISQNDFLRNPNVAEDVNNPGYYFVGYQPQEDQSIGDTPYIITYIAETDYFLVTLAQEPLGSTRRSAEQYLMKVLQLSQEQMCALNYSVSTLNSINDQYSGMNIGFSFCSGAVKLPL
jgi:hypothetical protein